MKELDVTFTSELQHADQSLEVFRTSYLAADGAARSRARDYVNSLADLAKNRHGLALPGHDVVLHTVDGSSAKEGDVLPMELSVSILAKAIAAWDQGELYPPTALDILDH